MKKTILAIAFAVFLSPALASFTPTQVDEYNQTKLALLDYSATINHDYPGADALIFDFVSTDHLQGTYEDMVQDLIDLVLDIKSLNSTAYETDTQAEEKLAILRDHLVEIITVWTNNMDYSKDMYQNDDLNISVSSHYEWDTVSSSNDVSLNLQLEKKFANDLSDMEMWITMDWEFSQEYKDTEYEEEENMNAQVDLTAEIIKNDNDLFLKLNDLVLSSNDPEDENIAEANQEIETLKEMVWDNYVHLNLEELWMSDIMFLNISDMLEIFNTNILSAYTDWKNTFVNLDQEICNILAIFDEDTEYCIEEIKYTNKILWQDLVYSVENYGTSRIDIQTEEFEDSYITWTNDKLKEINIQNQDGFFKYNLWNLSFDMDGEIKWNGYINPGESMKLNIETLSYFSDEYDTTTVDISNNNNILKYNISATDSETTFSMEWTSTYWNLSSFETQAPTNTISMESLMMLGML